MPYSLLIFVTVGVVFVLQALPEVGIILMFMLAPFWSIILINIGMIGILIEALTDRVSSRWLALPLAFYGIYWTVATLDHLALRSTSATYHAANQRVQTGFDPTVHSLVFAEDNGDASPVTWLTQNYALAVAYSENSAFAEGYMSFRLADMAVCSEIRQSDEMHAAFIHASAIYDGEAIGSRSTGEHLCNLSMPERPDLPIVRVLTAKSYARNITLPITQTVTTITMPDGREDQLLGGFAAPLSWIPMPVLGCNLSDTGWVCGAGFIRNNFTPIVPGETKYSRDSIVLARALGLAPVAIGERQGADSTLVLEKVSAVVEATLLRQLDNINGVIADPSARLKDWQVDVIVSKPEVLAAHSEAIMSGLERAARVERAREGGLILARLLTKVPSDKFVVLTPRILVLFQRAGRSHWLWESTELLERLVSSGSPVPPRPAN